MTRVRAGVRKKGVRLPKVAGVQNADVVVEWVERERVWSNLSLQWRVVALEYVRISAAQVSAMQLFSIRCNSSFAVCLPRYCTAPALCTDSTRNQLLYCH